VGETEPFPWTRDAGKAGLRKEALIKGCANMLSHWARPGALGSLQRGEGPCLACVSFHTPCLKALSSSELLHAAPVRPCPALAISRRHSLEALQQIVPLEKEFPSNRQHGVYNGPGNLGNEAIMTLMIQPSILPLARP
jgi:hypothetical protein